MSALGVGLWAVWVATFVGYEWWDLRKTTDDWPPLTDVIKRLVMRRRGNPFWWVMLGLWGWLGYHFFVQGW